jgi:hypothetical protein
MSSFHKASPLELFQGSHRTYDLFFDLQNDSLDGMRTPQRLGPDILDMPGYRVPFECDWNFAKI